MFPNIDVNDRVLVVKDNLFEYKYAVGDIVVFHAPESEIPNSQDLLVKNLKIWNLITENEGDINDFVFIKRIVGTPGDNVFIDSNGKIFVNNKELIIQNVDIASNSENFNINLMKDEYFLVGDNRNNSFDSRLFGPISIERIIGKAYFKIYPFNEFTNFND